MQRLVELVVIDLADYATIELTGGDGRIALAAAAATGCRPPARSCERSASVTVSPLMRPRE